MLNHVTIAMVTATLALLSAAAPAARLVQPPLTELARSHIVVLQARAVEDAGDGSYVFDRIADLSGHGEARISVRVDEDTRAGLETGKSYILAYTSVINHPRRREEKLIDPDGPRLVKLRGFGTTALFEDNGDVRLLFRGASDGNPADDAKATLTMLIRQLQRPDLRTRTLVTGELFLRDDLHPHINRKMARGMGDAVNDPGLSDELKSYLVETLASLPAERTGEWLFDSVRQIIDAAGIEYELASHRPRLVSESVQALLPGAQAKDRSRMVPLLKSNAPRVVESAIAVLERLDPAGAAQAVSETLEAAQWDDSLSAPSRRILEAYLVEALVGKQVP